MADNKDPRYKRTETLIRTAFLELIRDASVASVTASDICRRAGISRNAFYLHHSGVTALYIAMVDELLADVRGACIDSAKRVSASGELDEWFMSSVLFALERHERLLRSLLPSDDGSITQCLADGIADAYVAAALELSEEGDSLEHRLRCAFSAWALLGAIRQWLSLTAQPISGMLGHLAKFHAGIQVDAMRYLTGDTGLRP